MTFWKISAVFATLLYAGFAAPFETIYSYLRARFRDEDGAKRAYFSHVGLVGDLIARVVRFPVTSLRLPSDGPVLRSLLRATTRAQLLLLNLFDPVPGVVVRPETEKFGTWVTPQTSSFATATAATSHVMLYFHGGGFVNNSPDACVPLAKQLIRAFNAKAKITNRSDISLSIFLSQYPLCPESSFSNILDDCFEAYKFLLHRGYKNIMVAGDSAGGNIALNLISILKSEYPDLIQPISAVLFCPWVDPFVSILPKNFPREISRNNDVLSLENSRYMASKVASTISSEIVRYKLSPIDWENSKLASSIPEKGILIVYGGGDILRGGLDFFVDKILHTTSPPSLSDSSHLIIKKRYPYVCHDFQIVYLLLFGVAQHTALKAIRDAAEFMFNTAQA
ncbi:hypothetical protein HK100_007187 [Physocladia obscura]|uniref:Alpha/beta hydrolase fold-3 domain-containing protein n=1 Tax=Physocladia obscura TaxID=109957 RepID=A0AAD5XIC3_9FUNG|nr:hypothetical protein HK100_007187 [Physocladia obscura]